MIKFGEVQIFKYAIIFFSEILPFKIHTLILLNLFSFQPFRLLSFYLLSCFKHIVLTLLLHVCSGVNKDKQLFIVRYVFFSTAIFTSPMKL